MKKKDQVRNNLNKELENEKLANVMLKEELGNVKAESEKVCEVERNQAKMLDTKDKLIDNMTRDLKNVKDRNIDILKESKKKKQIVKKLEKEKNTLSKENNDLKQEIGGKNAIIVTLKDQIENSKW